MWVISRCNTHTHNIQSQFVQPKYRLIYQADPHMYNVRKWCPYFYQVAWHYLKMMPDDRQELATAVATLLEVSRATGIIC